MLKDTDALKSRISDMMSRIAPWQHRVGEVAAQLWDANAVPEGHWSWRRQEVRRLARLKVRDPSHEQVFSVLDELCDYYLTATPDEREAVRNLFDAFEDDAVVSLLYYARSAGDQIKYKGDTGWLRRGLAAVSIADCRPDPRDAGDVLQELRDDALRAGIDPQPFLREVGRMSNTLRLRGISAWHLFMDVSGPGHIATAAEVFPPKQRDKGTPPPA